MPSLDDADEDAADDVDERDEDAGHRVAADELAGTIHRSVEVGLLGDLLAPLAGALLVDQASVELGVDRHLLAGHGVQGEARRDLGDAPGALGDDHEVDDDEDRKDDQTDDVAAAHHHFAEGADDVPRRVGARGAMQQDEARAGHIEREAKERGRQQQQREDAELDRILDVERDQEDEQAGGDREGQQQVEDEGRQRQHHDDQERDHRPGHRHVSLLTSPSHQPRLIFAVRLRRHSRSLRHAHSTTGWPAARAAARRTPLGPAQRWL